MIRNECVCLFVEFVFHVVFRSIGRVKNCTIKAHDNKYLLKNYFNFLHIFQLVMFSYRAKLFFFFFIELKS